MRCPRPNLSSMSAHRSGPTRWASISVPTLEDFPKTPVVVYGMTPCSHASWTVTPPMSMEPGTCSTSSGLVRPNSMADDAVMILFTEPGSNGEDTDEVAQFAVVLPADVLARVERVVVRHRKHLTGFRVEHDGRDVLGAGQVLGLLDLLLDVELDVVVDGELHRRAVDRVVAVAVAAGDHHAVGAAVVGDRSVGARELRVQRVLEAEQSVAVPVDAADDVGGQRATRVLPDVLTFGADLGVLRRDRVGDRGIDGAGQVDERVLAATAS